MRYNCDVPGLEGSWVDVSEQWTRGEILAYQKAQTPTQEMDWLQRKVTACHVQTIGGDPITDPAALTLETVDASVDLRLFWFLGSVITTATAEMRALSPLPKRLLSEKPGTTA